MNKKELLTKINENVHKPVAGPSTATAATAPGVKPRHVRSAKSKPVEYGQTSVAAGTGRTAAFWLDANDRALFHEAGMMLYAQGIKPSDSLILRAALRLMPRDHRLLDQVRELLERDGRKLRHQKPTEQEVK
jgi:hypothetical protein